MVNLGNGGTFAQLYANLTSDDPANAWPNFQNAINSLPNGVTNDDPFNALGQAVQMTHLSPRAAELVGRVLAALVSDLAAGRPPEQLAANVRAALLPAFRPSGSSLVLKRLEQQFPDSDAG
jgi:hypothetical protein